MGASPVKLVVMLYDGALRFMDASKRAMAAGDTYKQNEQSIRAQNIVLELMSTLDMKQGGEISQNLMALYTFVLEKLIEGNVEDKSESIDVAAKIMSDLRDGWVQLEQQQIPTEAIVAA
jgi:flagellar protein FliS